MIACLNLGMAAEPTGTDVEWIRSASECMNIRMNWIRSRMDPIEMDAMLIKNAIVSTGFVPKPVETASNSIEFGTDPIGSASFSTQPRSDRMERAIHSMHFACDPTGFRPMFDVDPE